MMQRLALLLLVSWGLSVRSLHVLPVSVFVFYLFIYLFESQADQ